jgi:hypothetical protein
MPWRVCEATFFGFACAGDREEGGGGRGGSQREGEKVAVGGTEETPSPKTTMGTDPSTVPITGVVCFVCSFHTPSPNHRRRWKIIEMVGSMLSHAAWRVERAAAWKISAVLVLVRSRF